MGAPKSPGREGIFISSGLHYLAVRFKTTPGMKRYLLTVVALLSFVCGFAQQTILQPKASVTKPEALLFALNSNSNQVTMYKKLKMEKEAKELIEQTQKDNQAIVQAFSQYFNFCPVYFYYNDANSKVAQKDFDGIFLDSTLIPDPTIRMKTGNFMVAYYGYHTQDQKNVTDAKGNTSTEMEATGFAIPHKEGITVMDSDLKQLSLPFPRFIKANFRYRKELVNGVNVKIYEFKGAGTLDHHLKKYYEVQ